MCDKLHLSAMSQNQGTCFGSWFKERDIIVFSALISGHSLRVAVPWIKERDIFVFSAHVSGHGLKNEIYSCVARIVSGHGTTNEKYIHV